MNEEIPESYRELKDSFLKALKEAAQSAVTKKKELLLVFDALNQFDDSYSPSTLDWIPEEIPPGLHIVVSTLKGIFLENLARRPISTVDVGPLDTEERKEIVRQTLWEYRKKLDSHQVHRTASLCLHNKDGTVAPKN